MPAESKDTPETIPTPAPAVQPPAPDRGHYQPKKPAHPRFDRTFNRSSRHRGQWNKKNKG